MWANHQTTSTIGAPFRLVKCYSDILHTSWSFFSEWPKVTKRIKPFGAAGWILRSFPPKIQSHGGNTHKSWQTGGWSSNSTISLQMVCGRTRSLFFKCWKNMVAESCTIRSSWTYGQSHIGRKIHHECHQQIPSFPNKNHRIFSATLPALNNGCISDYIPVSKYIRPSLKAFPYWTGWPMTRQF